VATGARADLPAVLQVLLVGAGQQRLDEPRLLLARAF